MRTALEEALRQHESRLEELVDPHDIAVVLQRRSEQARGEILAALTRIEQGTYGSCAGCASPISIDRLEALPHASHCAACARRS